MTMPRVDLGSRTKRGVITRFRHPGSRLVTTDQSVRKHAESRTESNELSVISEKASRLRLNVGSMIRLRVTDQTDRFSRSDFKLHPRSGDLSQLDATPKARPMGIAIRARAAMFVDILGRN